MFFSLTSLLAFLLFADLSLRQGAAKSVRYTLSITEGPYTGDCYVRKHTLLVNNTSPGPAIHVSPGDDLTVIVENHTNTTLSIHFHGLHHQLSPWSDGVSGVSQLPIQPGHSFPYVTKILNSPGTYYYHFHQGFHLKTGFGMFIVHDNVVQRDMHRIRDKKLLHHPGRDRHTDHYYAYRSKLTIPSSSRSPLPYHDDLDLMLSELYHASNEELEAGLLAIPFRWTKDPDSLLMNGLTYKQWNCTGKPACTTNERKCAYPVLPVYSGKRYRIRVVGATVLHYLALRIEGHQMIVIEVDGYYVQPYVTNELHVNSGQRYSVILQKIHQNDHPRDFFMSMKPLWRKSGLVGVGLLRYMDAPKSTWRHRRRPLEQLALTRAPLPDKGKFMWDEYKFRTLPYTTDGRNRIYPSIPKPHREIIIAGRQNKAGNGKIVWEVNNRTHFEVSDRKVPLFFQYYTGQRTFPAGKEFEREIRNNGYSEKHDLYHLKKGEVVQVVLQNYGSLNGICEQHSWHLHGYSFYDIGGGPGLYDPKKFNTQRAVPSLRDALTIYPSTNSVYQSPGKRDDACGYRVFRLVVSHSGVWPFHCHMNAHLVMGMQVTFSASMDPQNRPKLPPFFDAKGNVIGKMP